MQVILLTFASVSLAAAFASFVKRVRWLALVLFLVGAAIFLYVAWEELTRADGPSSRSAASSAPAGSRAVWLKLAAPPGEHLPAEWRCRVTSFSGEWQGRCSKSLMRKRGRTWSTEQVVAKFPSDLVGSTNDPPPGTYEVEWTTLVADEDGTIVENMLARIEFEYE